jgi:hypothetical protein
LVRADDARYDRALEFLARDFSPKGQLLLLTGQEMRIKWFLKQHRELRKQIETIPAPAQGAPSPAIWAQSS